MHPLARKLGIASSAALASVMSSCALSQLSDETTALSSAAAQFKTISAADAPLTAARDSAGKARLIEMLAGGTLPPLNSCPEVDQVAAQFDEQTTKGDEERGAATYQALMRLPSCSWSSRLEPDPKVPAPPLIKALNDYYSGVGAIASATSIQQVTDATTKTTSAISSIAKFVPVPGVDAGVQALGLLVNKLVQTDLQTAQYRALEATLGDVDPALSAARAPIISALRVTQGYRVREVTSFAKDGYAAIHDTLQSARDPQLRFALYQATQPLMEDLSADEQNVRVDPATSFNALMSAHHDLYRALRSGRKQLAPVLTAAQGLANAAAGLTSAVPPAALK